jgi:hypothetical protein
MRFSIDFHVAKFLELIDTPGKLETYLEEEEKKTGVKWHSSHGQKLFNPGQDAAARARVSVAQRKVIASESPGASAGRLRLSKPLVASPLCG